MPRGRHVHVHRCRRRRAGVHRAGAARPGGVPGRSHRPDPRGVRAGPAPVRQLVRSASAAPVPGPPGGHRVLRPWPGGPRPGPGHHYPAAVHHCRVLPVRRRGRPARSFTGRPCPSPGWTTIRTPPGWIATSSAAAGLGQPAEHALISLLALDGLRVSEATGANIGALGVERGHRTLTIIRKGGKVATIPLAPRTARAIDLAVGERCDEPLFLAP